PSRFGLFACSGPVLAFVLPLIGEPSMPASRGVRRRGRNRSVCNPTSTWHRQQRSRGDVVTLARFRPFICRTRVVADVGTSWRSGTKQPSIFRLWNAIAAICLPAQAVAVDHHDATACRLDKAFAFEEVQRQHDTGTAHGPEPLADVVPVQ